MINLILDEVHFSNLGTFSKDNNYPTFSKILRVMYLEKSNWEQFRVTLLILIQTLVLPNFHHQNGKELKFCKLVANGLLFFVITFSLMRVCWVYACALANEFLMAFCEKEDFSVLCNDWLVGSENSRQLFSRFAFRSFLMSDQWLYQEINV